MSHENGHRVAMLHNIRPPHRVAVFRALQLGDMLCAVPALRALRAALPHAEIVLIGLPWARNFVSRYPRYLDDCLSFPGFPGLPEQPAEPRALIRFFAEAQAHGFDLAIQMHGDGRLTNLIVPLLGARANAGFYGEGDACPHPARFLQYPEHQSEIARLLSLMAFLGAPPQGDMLEFAVTAEDRWQLAQIPEAHLLVPGRYVCIHPGARAAARRWGVGEFARVADALAESGERIVITGGPDEVAIAETLARHVRVPPLNLAGRTSLGALAALLSRARLLVCNDTGVSHLATALHVPSVVIFTGSDPARWAPLDRARHRPVIAGAGVAAVDRVIAEAHELLSKERAHAA
jgi:ADP-heptose:LPS heptosyltransferase